jgi:catechol 2,3-dioxygenase-like lactoylglutathione lyase family enzyme
MNQSIGQVAIVVRDCEKAQGFYVGILGFQLIGRYARSGTTKTVGGRGSGRFHAVTPTLRTRRWL